MHQSTPHNPSPTHNQLCINSHLPSNLISSLCLLQVSLAIKSSRRLVLAQQPSANYALNIVLTFPSPLVASLGPDYCCKPSGHAFYEVPTYFYWYFLPFLLNSVPQLSYALSCLFILSQLDLEMIPEVLMCGD